MSGQPCSSASVKSAIVNTQVQAIRGLWGTFPRAFCSGKAYIYLIVLSTARSFYFLVSTHWALSVCIILCLLLRGIQEKQDSVLKKFKIHMGESCNKENMCSIVIIFWLSTICQAVTCIILVFLILGVCIIHHILLLKKRYFRVVK